jgi:DNA-binding transcriptional LysR family regulator
VNLRNLDLNLLVVLDAVLEEGGVTGAATRLGISQPAVSNALGRLRDALGVPLFVRRGRRVAPTAEARALAPAIRSSLAALDRALSSRAPFTPARATGRFALAISDYWYARMLPRLMAHLARHAPGVQLETVPTGEDVVSRDLAGGAVDAAIFLHPRDVPGVRSEILLSDGYVLVVRSGHPISGPRIDLHDLARHRHVLISPEGPWLRRLVGALAHDGLAATIALRTSQVKVAMEIVAGSDYVTVMARGPADQLRPAFPVRLLPLPMESEGFTLALYWHERTQDDPLAVWLRGVVTDLARKVYPV